MPDTIETFTTALARGEALAVETFYRQYFDTLYAHARRFAGRDESFCLDVVQDSVLRVIRAVRPAKTQAQFSAWLKLVVQTTAYDLLRRESRRQKRELVLAARFDESTNRDDGPCDEERLAWLAEQISSMDRELVRIIDLRFQKRWTLSQIAQSLGLSIGTVDGRLRRALIELRRQAGKAFDA